MDSPAPRIPEERIHGLDPRALLARAAGGADIGALLLAWVPPSIAEMARLFPQFEVLELIGRGGMGAVYRARQPALDRLVAIKLVPREAASEATFAERFRLEARALARLHHPHIVTVYDSGETVAGQLFFVMEHVAGTDLAQQLANGPLPPARALAIARAVCAALAYAHADGIVHRDIKPANVLLGDDGSVKVADFGLARLRPTNPALNTSRLTLTGSALGTPDYVAPEQRAGREVDERADLYSLGVMLYEMLTGDLPRGAWQPPSRKAHSSPRLDGLVEQVLQADPRRRPQSATELATRLERIPTVPPTGLWKVVMAGCATVALAAGGIWLALPRPTPSPPATGSGVKRNLGLWYPLTALDLKAAAQTGNWHWLDDVPGETLALPLTKLEDGLKILRFPVPPGEGAYEMSCEVLLEDRSGHLNWVLPAGSARFAFVFDLFDCSGLELVRGTQWKNNETAVVRLMPTGRFLSLKLSVRPEGGRVSIGVLLDGQPFIQWEGPQADLAIHDQNLLPWMLAKPGPVFALSSRTGGFRVRAMQVTRQP